MQHIGDRRVPGVRRVSVERMVDVCGSGAPASAFQGQSVDVSGRGMQLRSSHLPALGAPLVLRFAESAGEVIAEGEVAWRNEEVSGGGEFGVRFTALDSKSVRSLKALCLGPEKLGEPLSLEDGFDAKAGRATSDESSAHEDSSAQEQEHDTEPVPPAGPFMADATPSPVATSTSPTPRAPVSSVPVRQQLVQLLLSDRAPIQAHVRRRSENRLELGSQLEFLRVGRSLEVEDVAQGDRRAARIDAVDVSVDQSSQVPELIVSVRYADAPETPLPAPSRSFSTRPERPREPAPLGVAKAHTRSEPASPEPLRIAKAHALPEPRPAASDRVQVDDRVPAEDAAAESLLSDPSGLLALRDRLEGAWQGASTALRVARHQCAELSGVATRGAGWLVARARRARALGNRPAPPLRRTAAVPASALRQRPVRQHARAGGPFRPQTPVTAPLDSPRRNRYLALGGLLLLTALVGAFLGRRSEGPEAQAPEMAAAPAVPAAAPALPASAAPASPLPAIPSDAVTAPAMRPPGPAEEMDADEEEPGDAVARVPLFGPSSLGVNSPEANAPQAKAPEIALARSKAHDLLFEEAPKSRSKPAVSEFGSGRLHLPIVYRLRLDQPGESLRGERTPTGFDVLIPERRVMESGADIARRDDRIAKVITRKESGGTRVSFRFRRSIPAYKVRLRKDFVEFFISSPGS
jgi:hypothetical protein